MVSLTDFRFWATGKVREFEKFILEDGSYFQEDSIENWVKLFKEFLDD